MKNLKNVRFSAWNESGRTACAIKADVPGMDGVLSSIYFFFGHEEFENFVKGQQQSFRDCNYFMNNAGELCTFYYMDLPYNKENGKIEVPYVNVKIPYFVRKILLRWARDKWKTPSSKETNWERPCIEISQKKIENWSRLYGQGKGQCQIVMSDEAKNLLEDKLVNDNFENSLQDCLDCLNVIALNSTWSFLNKTEVRLSKDGDGFFFVVPQMVGGIFKSRYDNKWSIHT